MLREFEGFKGHVGESSQMLLRVLDAYSASNEIFERLYVYGNQKLHQDMGDSDSQQQAGELDVLMNRMSTAQSFMVPEILAIPEETLEQWYVEEPKLEFYRIYLEEILRLKPHTLDAGTEEILALAEDMSKAPSNIYAMFNNADLAFAPIENEQGKKVPLTQGVYVSLMQSQNRKVRKDAFSNLYREYSGFRNTMAAIYEANVRQSAFFAKVRHYDTSLEAALDENHIPVSVYDNLIASVREHMEPMYRYMNIRKKVMGLDELHMYDIYVPLVKDADRKIPFENAKELVKEGLKPLGEEYQGLLQEGFDNRWIDVYENENKRTGAYSWGAYGTHPYVLLNYHNTLNDVFTLAHEMGHAIHSWYSDDNQAYLYAGYKIFVAEVASTCNEVLMIHHFIEQAKEKQGKAYLINYLLEQFRTTLYRQTMFAEFEKTTHDIVDQGGTFNAQTLGKIYQDLNKAYYGDEVVSDRQIKYEWARIPHFYTPFYVYQYATGFSAAIAITSRILKGDKKTLEGYFKFLKGGCSMSPIELLKLTGVDMTTREPVDNALKIFAKYVDEFEKLML
jgi:oligoendopeptidase F